MPPVSRPSHSQGWVSLVIEDAAEAFRVAEEYMEKKETVSIAYHGNIVDLLQYAVDNNIKNRAVI